ncbi:alanine racemase domain-containing protein [Diplodia corticola]|uniref:D-serine dehydratase n=1 Tax=Diplodia corticola TaxID=236234 RepID=A0A1J9QZD7_9PEZI|nr:alanine racemase domain-containing protein [Diplodia corticola]OJD33737.1 alanine racemase domain-containing protein [Diplodia corticola]
MVDVSKDYLNSFIGRPALDLPTPSLVLSKPVIEKNCKRLHDDVKTLGIGFRPHVKTLKSEEVTRLMLGTVSRSAVASTIREIRGLLPLAASGHLDDVLYGLPIRPSALPELAQLAASTTPPLKILLMLDHPSQIPHLAAFAAAHPSTPPWSCFIKIDMGTRRAGLPLASPALPALIRAAEAAPHAVHIHGFYCHAGHSYAARDPSAAQSVLRDEVGAALAAAKLLSSPSGADDDDAPAATAPVVVSFGSTPTAHVVAALKDEVRDAGFVAGGRRPLALELHAGNFPANDLQQLGTACVAEADQAVRVLAEVCSVYPERGEALVNAGVIALAREAGPLSGFAQVVGRREWCVGRLSQEHGILVREGGGEKGVEEVFEVGEKVWLWIQHACITAAAHYYYFVVDEEDVVREVWYPWKGW